MQDFFEYLKQRDANVVINEGNQQQLQVFAQQTADLLKRTKQF